MPLILSLPWWFSDIRERGLKLEGKEVRKGSNWDEMCQGLKTKSIRGGRSGALDSWLFKRIEESWVSECQGVSLGELDPGR